MHPKETPHIAAAADHLVAIYNEPFGGKPRGRYRLSMKLMRQLLDRRRIWHDEIEALTRAMYERGYALIDMETFFVVIAHQTFTNTRRANEAGIIGADG
ncbi:hypothetical protein [Minwuia sp.]|uniref:hypothetical protein n=1 Tax=Minwuia sp. TaxID=2493630 RepID=UPI003A95DF5D